MTKYITGLSSITGAIVTITGQLDWLNVTDLLPLNTTGKNYVRDKMGRFDPLVHSHNFITNCAKLTLQSVISNTNHLSTS